MEAPASAQAIRRLGVALERLASPLESIKSEEDVTALLQLRALLRIFAAVGLALLLVAESAGVARAYDACSITHCCCGSHSVARVCKCEHCPARRGKQISSEQGHLDAPSDCVAHAQNDALVVTATLVSHAPRLIVAPLALLDAPRLLAPPSLVLDPARPPP